MTLLNDKLAVSDGTTALDRALDDPDAHGRQRAVVGLLATSGQPTPALGMLSRALTDAHRVDRRMPRRFGRVAAHAVKLSRRGTLTLMLSWTTMLGNSHIWFAQTGEPR